jgi:hypothetical protein
MVLRRLLHVFLVPAAVAAAYMIGAIADSKTHRQVPAFVGFAPASIHLGERLWNERIPFELTFTNSGPEAVTLTRLETSCGCTLINGEQIEGATVEPDAAIRIAGELLTETAVGEKRVEIKLWDDRKATYRAAITAMVRGTYRISPDAVSVGGIRTDSDVPPERVLRFESIDVRVAGGLLPKI